MVKMKFLRMISYQVLLIHYSSQIILDIHVMMQYFEKLLQLLENEISCVTHKLIKPRLID